MVSKNLLKKENVSKPNGFINFGLMQHLTPNEFYLYTYLINAPSNFAPTYDKFMTIMKIRSKTTIHNILRTLKQHGLLDTERVEHNVWIWTVYHINETEARELIIEKVEQHQKSIDRIELQERIDILQKTLDIVSGEAYDNTLDELLKLQMELGRND